MKTMEISKASRTRRQNKIKRSMVASLGACYMGGIIPALTFGVAHFQAPSLFGQWSPQSALWLVVLGGLAYSGPMVASWFSCYAGTFKGWGFVVSLEVAMTWTDLYTAIPALLTLCVLNGMILRDKFAND